MLQQFTWQQFLVAALVLSVIWYVLVILIFYRNEFFKLFGGGKVINANRFKSTDPLPHRWEKGVDKIEDAGFAEKENLMGISKLPEGMTSVGSDEFSFGGSEQQVDAKMEQVGLVADVLQELKGVFASLAANDGDKLDFMEMMERVREKFPKIASSPSIGRINAYVSENAPFYLSKSELENLWD